MTDFIEIGLIDLSKFVETRYVDHNFSEVSDKDTNIKYLMIKFSSIINSFDKSNIIAFSQEVNIHFQLMHPAILKIIGYNLVNFNKSPYPIIITELPTNYTLGNALSLGRSGENYPLLKDNDQVNSELVGTPAYLAPEILITRTYSKKSDVYAFSLILYEILTNKRPFESFKDVSILFEEVSVYKTRPEFDNEIPKCYKNLIEKCWSHDPQDRPTFDEILDILKNNHDFIIDQDDSEEFHKYIEFIDSSKTSFDEKKRAKHLDHIINTQLPFFSYRNNIFNISKYGTSISPIYLKSFMFDFSNFERHEKIGEGSFGRVYKIVNKDTGEIYAAKEFLRSRFSASQNYKILLREIKTLSNIEFPSIIGLIGFNYNNIKNKPKLTLILEYASNGSLHNILELERKGEKDDEWNDTIKLINIYGIASAINYLHHYYVMHRDLKPRNILLNDYLHPKISDFGLTRIMDDSTDSTDVPNTPEYMAPEVLLGNAYSKKNDIYSFAMIMYEIMTGERPFKDLKNPVDIVNEVTQNNGRPKFNTKIPDCYRCLIEKCWVQEEDERPSADEIIEILKTDPEFITENVNKEEFFNYVEYIDSAVLKKGFDYEANMPKFEKAESKDHSFQKVDIYLNRPKTIEQRNLSINIQPLDLDRYEIKQSVGEGMFGTVYKVIDKETREVLAAKVSIYDIDLCSDDIIYNLEREVNIISKLNHPSVTKFIGFNPLNFKYKRKPTIVTEFASNGSLDKIIELERMNIAVSDWDDTKKLINIYGIASALSYLHSLNIIHRDLKPANILLDEYLFPKITDSA